jgi:hypothetical protein
VVTGDAGQARRQERAQFFDAIGDERVAGRQRGRPAAALKPVLFRKLFAAKVGFPQYRQSVGVRSGSGNVGLCAISGPLIGFSDSWQLVITPVR